VCLSPVSPSSANLWTRCGDIDLQKRISLINLRSSASSDLRACLRSRASPSKETAPAPKSSKNSSSGLSLRYALAVSLGSSVTSRSCSRRDTTTRRASGAPSHSGLGGASPNLGLARARSGAAAQVVGMQKDSLRSPLAHGGAPLRDTRRSAGVASPYQFSGISGAVLRSMAAPRVRRGALGRLLFEGAFGAQRLLHAGGRRGGACGSALRTCSCAFARSLPRCSTSMFPAVLPGRPVVWRCSLPVAFACSCRAVSRGSRRGPALLPGVGGLVVRATSAASRTEVCPARWASRLLFEASGGARGR